MKALDRLAAKYAGEITGLGGRLKAAREARALTLEDLSESASLTKGYLSKVERDQATPSVAVLLRLCNALGLSAGDLFDPQAGQDVVRRADRGILRFGGEGLLESLLTPSHEKRIQVIHSKIDPGGGSGSELYSLPSRIEFAYVISGQVEIRLGERVEELVEGDALTFAPSEPHSFYNSNQEKHAEILWVFSPALPEGPARA